MLTIPVVVLPVRDEKDNAHGVLSIVGTFPGPGPHRGPQRLPREEWEGARSACVCGKL